jgi:pimeloyl-ACP methyl ester carboxylesterase
MKSSSALFPVSLFKAETWDDFNEDVYLLKHNQCDDKTVELALTRLTPRDGATAGRPPVVLVHGSFSNRGFWLSHKGQGLARHLLEEGFDVWMYEHRGHGLSPRNQAYRGNTLEQYVLSDVVAVNAFVCEQSGRSPFWLGHSLGGVVIASAVAAGLLNKTNIAGITLLGTQAIRRPWYLWLPLAGVILRGLVDIKGELDGRKLRIGPENEPAGLVNEYLRRHDWFGRWKLKATRQKLLPAWQQSDVPLLAVVAEADRSDPAKHCKRFYQLYASQIDDFSDKALLTLSRSEGFSKDYGHVDMVVSKEAAQEVWPKISGWLKGHE